MFDIGWSELVVIVVVALVVIGPKELPGVIRGLGQTVAKLRRMAGDFQGQFNEALKEAELTDLKKSVDELRSIANPLQAFKDEVRSTIEGAAAEAERALPQFPADPMQTPVDTPPPATPEAVVPPPAMPEAILPPPAVPEAAPPPASAAAETSAPVAPTAPSEKEDGGRAA